MLESLKAGSVCQLSGLPASWPSGKVLSVIEQVIKGFDFLKLNITYYEQVEGV